MTFRESAPLPPHRASRPPQSSENTAAPGSPAAPQEASAPRRWAPPRRKARRREMPRPLRLALRPQRHGDDRALGEVLNGDAKGQDKRACRRDLRVPRKEARIHHADRHSLRNVMQGHCQHHHGGAAQPAFRSLRLIASHMKVGNQMVEQEQKQHADPEADKGGKEGQLAHALRLLDGWDQQAPDGRCHHHPGGKARKGALHRDRQGIFS